MKTFIHLPLIVLLLAGLGVAQTATAQEVTETVIYNSKDSVKNAPGEHDTTKIILKNTRILIISDSTVDSDWDDDDDLPGRKSYWAGIEIGVGGYLTEDNSTTLPNNLNHLELNYAESVTWNLNFLEPNIPIAGEHVKLVTGLGLQFNHYSFDNNTTLLKLRDSIGWEITDTNRVFTRNKLKTTYLNVPLMIAFNSGKESNKGVHLATGMIFGYRIGSRYKQRYEVDGDVVKPVVRSDYHQNPFRLAATARIGYGKYTLFGTYSLNPLFEDGRGPELYPFTVGIRLIGF